MGAKRFPTRRLGIVDAASTIRANEFPQRCFRAAWEKVYPSTMTKLLEHAVGSLRTLPPGGSRRSLARLLLQVAAQQPVILLTSEERADLAEADAEIARGEFATDEQAILAKPISVKLRVTRRAATQIEKALDYIEVESPQSPCASNCGDSTHRSVKVL